MRSIRLKSGFKVKDGKVVRSDRHLNVSQRLKQRGSKRVRVVRKRRAKGNVEVM